VTENALGGPSSGSCDGDLPHRWSGPLARQRGRPRDPDRRGPRDRGRGRPDRDAGHRWDARRARQLAPAPAQPARRHGCGRFRPDPVGPRAEGPSRSA